MMPPHCTSTSLNDLGISQACVLEISHDGDHMDRHGRTWEDPGVVLARLTAKWGRTHRFACTGRTWLARHRAPSHWQVESAPSPEQLEEHLRAHHGPPPGPPDPTKTETARAHV